MIRKTILALAATAALGVAALAPTSASAGWHGGWHHGWHGGWGHGYGYGLGVSLYNPYVYNTGSCYIVKRVVDTDFGPKVRRVTVCN